MRLLVYGMQSSGATAFSLFLAQRPDCLALVDTPNDFAAPRLVTPLDVVVKVVVTTAYPLAVHVERFRPDRILLWLRDPRDNYRSLETKNYRHHCGLMEEKFVVLDQVFAAREHFDAVIEYEDFVARDPAIISQLAALGWPVTEECYVYRRRHDELFAALWQHVPDLFQRMDMVFGNVQGSEVSERFREESQDADLERRLEALCPRLLAHYREHRSRAGIVD